MPTPTCFVHQGAIFREFMINGKCPLDKLPGSECQPDFVNILNQIMVCA